MSRKSRETLREELGDAMRAHQAAVDAFDEAVAENLGVNRTDLRCMDVLLQVGAATPGELGTRLGLTTGSVTAMLDRLERLGYLRRSPDPSDRRRVTVRPTAEPERIAVELYGPLAREGAQVTARYTIAELELLIDFLRRSRQLQDQHLTRVRSLPAPRRRR